MNCHLGVRELADEVEGKVDETHEAQPRRRQQRPQVHATAAAAERACSALSSDCRNLGRLRGRGDPTDDERGGERTFERVTEGKT